ncbi:MAG: MFS transporter [Marinovum algicola]|uniref:Fucose permease n=1 Tax=Marinovum algicola TaxID=42444 RepID=A0A975WAG0_9RHOB|nr:MULTISPECIES: MFS transporter [Marinovum]MDD9740241.1 MFS transporter [Marinovum sp. SP66]MDD9742412.1 MFS transporter [Marinovum sp. PR37]SEJ56385.1 Fucose permease [Marinovum algicola]SLN50582.1 putative MFS-type transporter YcaD [Marinovum algicola]
MMAVVSNAWALLLGIMLLMVGNGLQGTLLGVRGEIEGFTTLEMSIVMSAYFVGFLGGSRMAPEMIRRVGHVRVFAALGSFISAVLILYPALTHPIAWTLGRVIIGFCFSGVYVTAESWLNNAATNETRGQTLSAYMIVQMVGIVAAQGLLLVADPSGYALFVIISVLVSVSFAPILLSISPTPAFDTTKPLSLRELYSISPLGCVGMFLLGGVFSAQFGMAAVYGAEAGLTLSQISMFVAAFYIGALVVQYPLGWLSDRMDRRMLILAAALVCGLGAFLGALTGGYFPVLLVAAFMIGGMSNPLYSLLMAYTNDYLQVEDMAAASGGMIFINGVGAISGPLITGWAMGFFGPTGYFLYIGSLMILMSAYAAYRAMVRPSVQVEETTSYAPVGPSATMVAVEFAQEYAVAEAEEDEKSG